MNRSRALACAVGLMAGSWFFGGCTPEPEPVLIGLETDLAPCLIGLPPEGMDDDGVRSTCSDNLDAIIASGTVNACLLVRGAGGDGPDQRLPLNWDGSDLTQPVPAEVNLEPGERFDAALFFLTEAGGDGQVCNALTVETGCAGEALCALKLIDPAVTFAADGSTVLDFTDSGGQCVSENGAGFQSEGGDAERCDGLDNDCDRRVDETFPTLGDPCERFADGMDASSAPAECRTQGVLVCGEDRAGVTCGAAVPMPAAEEACDDRTGLDDDCDGRIDEGTDCFVCAADADCAGHPAGEQCVGIRCATCDPADPTMPGCSAGELCCGAGAGIACVATSLDQCTSCADGACDLTTADNCAERSCACGESDACSGGTPYCEFGACVQCRINGFAEGHDDCGPDALCCGEGSCTQTGPGPRDSCEACGVPCDQLATDRCVDRQCLCGVDEPCGGGTPVCDRVGTPQCVECIADAQCGGARPVCDQVRRTCVQCLSDVQCDGARPECIENACVECDASADSEAGGYRCEEAGETPICDGLGCAPCESDDQCEARPGDRDFCIEGQCWPCRPDAVNSGCGDPALPVCDPETRTCRGCEAVGQCNTDPEIAALLTRQCAPDGRCVGCVPDPAGGPPNLGCSPTGPTPVCGNEDVCRGCAADAECPAQAPLADEGDDEALTVCHEGACRACRPAADGQTQDGCQPDGPTPYCVGGDCVPCETDDNCAGIPGAAPICADGRCQECDPSDENRGCSAVGASICDAETFTCRGCEGDGECGPGLMCNAVGICTGCDPETNAGCDIAGDLPVCVDADGDGVAFCAPCESDDACVAVAPGTRGQCLDNGRCAACDPTDNAGCDALSALPACRAEDGELACRGCDSDRPCEDFAADRPFCVSDGSCRACDPVADGAFDDRGCALPTAVCDPFETTCRGCAENDECRGDTPVCRTARGVCAECAPETQEGCDPRGLTPFCDDASARCRACEADVECAGNPQGELCVEGRCQGCDPVTHAGCDPEGATSFCTRGEDGVAQCRRCLADAECDVAAPGLPECVEGFCRVCDPAGAGPEDDVGCEAPTAVCDRAQFECRGCRDNSDCPGDFLCQASGVCSECLPGLDGFGGCDRGGFAPVCDEESATCRACTNDAECVGNPQGEQCVAGQCLACDPGDHAGCDLDSLCCGDGDGLPSCQPTGLDGCTGCGVACTGADACVDRECRCGDADACTFPLAYCVDEGAGATCLECFIDEDCGVPGRAQCVDGLCEECDAGNGLGAPGCARETRPYCDPDLNGCRSCADDDSRCLEYPEQPQCVEDGCFECDPRPGATYAGCDVATAAPVCDTDDKACRGCGSDDECAAEFPALGQCVGDFCRVCDPGDAEFAGCAAEALCCLDGEDIPECRPSTFGEECEQCGEPCDPVTADNCSGRACQCGDAAACEGELPYCIGSACVECRDDVDCGDGTICVDNTCRACDPADNRNCPDGSDAPVCDGGTFTCRGCAADAECDADQPGRVCLDSGACRVCDPEQGDDLHQGCRGDELCCARDGEPRCEAVGPAADEQCEACDDACDPLRANVCADRSCRCGAEAACLADGDEPFCVGAGCVECRDENDCAAGEQCLEGACRACNPADNSGCVDDSETPVCDAGTFICRGCGANAECDGGVGPNNANGDVCLDSGACRICDPVAGGAQHEGCAGDELCCDRAGTPVCEGTGPAADGQCEACDQACDADAADACTDRGCACGGGDACDPAGGTPYCEGGACVECRVDGDDCAAGEQCLAGVCRACNPADNSGCVADSDAPVCDAGTFTCRGCGANAECDGGVGPNNANGNICLDSGACRVCDPVAGGDQHEGCAGDELCCDRAGTPVCEGTGPAADGQCEACDLACEVDAADACTDRGCACGDGAACDPASGTPICDGGACVECRVDGDDCGAGEQCLAGVCRACNPADNSGCVADSDTPVCDGNTFTCRACGANAECDGNAGPNNANGDICTVAGTCRECDVLGHRGCDAEQLCCDANGTPGCVDTDPAAACEDCVTACDADRADSCTGRTCGCGDGAPCDAAGAQPFCGNGACVGCRDANDCAVDEVCFENACVECGVDADCGGDTPVCVAKTCVACRDANDCAQGELCDGGACVECINNGDCGGGGNQCVDGVCVECIDDGDCAVGQVCAAGTCGTCDPADNRGCVADSSKPICDATRECRVCADNAECVGNANGEVCLPSGECRVCDVADHDGCAADELCCDDGGGAACTGTNRFECEACGEGCGNGINQCDGRTCGGCGDGPACADGEFCVNGFCF